MTKTEPNREIAAAKAGMDPQTARKYLRPGRVPSELPAAPRWRTRRDPFAEVWEEARQLLEVNPGLEAKTGFEHLHPVHDGQIYEKLGDKDLRVLNPARPGEPAVERFGWRFQMRDKVIQTENDNGKDVLNGDLGIVERVDLVEQQVTVRFDERLVKYDFGELDEVALAYAVTIHKSQGSEFPAAVIPLATQHYMLLQRNLIYTGTTWGKRLLVLVRQRKALGIAVHNNRPQRRYSGLLASLKSSSSTFQIPAR